MPMLTSLPGTTVVRNAFVIGVARDVEGNSLGDRLYLVPVVYALLHLGEHVSMHNKTPTPVGYKYEL